jgi:hypothetical protein
MPRSDQKTAALLVFTGIFAEYQAFFTVLRQQLKTCQWKPV